MVSGNNNIYSSRLNMLLCLGEVRYAGFHHARPDTKVPGHVSGRCGGSNHKAVSRRIIEINVIISVQPGDWRGEHRDISVDQA